MNVLVRYSTDGAANSRYGDCSVRDLKTILKENFLHDSSTTLQVEKVCETDI